MTSSPIPRQPATIIHTVWASAVFDHNASDPNLTSRTDDAECAVVHTVLKWIGDRHYPKGKTSYPLIATVLGITPRKVGDLLDEIPPDTTVGRPDDYAVFRISLSMALSQPLSTTIDALEREVFLAALLRRDLNKRQTMELLGTGLGRFMKHWPNIESELREAGLC